jgi:hypothetical protein
MLLVKETAVSLSLILEIPVILFNVCNGDCSNEKKNTFNKRNVYKMKKELTEISLPMPSFFSRYSVITPLISHSICSIEAQHFFFVFISIYKIGKCSNWNKRSTFEAATIFFTDTGTGLTESSWLVDRRESFFIFSIV